MVKQKKGQTMRIWKEAAPAVEERKVFIGGMIMTLALSMILFMRDHWKGAIFIGLWAPPVFRLADLIREYIEERN